MKSTKSFFLITLNWGSKFVFPIIKLSVNIHQTGQICNDSFVFHI